MERIPTKMARQLKDAGLLWDPGLHDEFVIPDRDLDDRVYVLSELLSTFQSIHGKPAVTFHGSLEWALDTLVTSEVIWIPSEGQLRLEILERLLAQPAMKNNQAERLDTENVLVLKCSSNTNICEIKLNDRWKKFEASTAPGAYGQALLFLLAG